MILFTFYFYAGVLYLVYYSIKTWLKLTNKSYFKINKYVGFAFIFIPILPTICLTIYELLNKHDRYPSNKRLEEIADKKLPINYKVLNDEYQDMWQDYAIYYDIQLDKESSKQLISSIKKSVYFNSNSFINESLNESDLIQSKSMRAVWSKCISGYKFNKPYGSTSYRISFDTLKNKLSYQEFAD